MQKEESDNVFRSDPLPLEIKWYCVLDTQYEHVMRSLVAACLGRVCLVWLLWFCGVSAVD